MSFRQFKLVLSGVLFLQVSVSLNAFAQTPREYTVDILGCLKKLTWSEDRTSGSCDVTAFEGTYETTGYPGLNGFNFAFPANEVNDHVTVEMSATANGFHFALSSEKPVDLDAVFYSYSQFAPALTRKFGATYYRVGNLIGKKLMPEFAEPTALSALKYPVRLEDCLARLQFGMGNRGASCNVEFDIQIPEGYKTDSSFKTFNFRMESGENVHGTLTAKPKGYEVMIFSFSKLNIPELVKYLDYNLLYLTEVEPKLRPNLLTRCSKLLR